MAAPTAWVASEQRLFLHHPRTRRLAAGALAIGAAWQFARSTRVGPAMADYRDALAAGSASGGAVHAHDRAVAVWQAVHPGRGALLDVTLVGFVVLTLLAAAAGAAIAVGDRRTGLLKVRLTLLGGARLFLVKVVEVVATAVLVVIGATVGAQAAAVATAALADPSTVPPDILAAPHPLDGASIASAVAATVTMVVLAGLLAFLLGHIVGEPISAAAVSVVALMALPLQGPADPRNALAVWHTAAAQGATADVLRAGHPTDAVTSAAVIVVWFAIATAGSWALMRWRSGHTTKRH